MARNETSSEPDFSWADIPKRRIKTGAEVYPHDPSERLRDEKFIARALVECLQEGDAEAFKEILGAHLDMVNKSDFAKRTQIPERTLYRMVSKNGNPTLDNIAKVVRALSR